MPKHIRRVTTRGLKRRDQDLPLERCTLLTGPNGSGKSQILEAVQMVMLGEVPRLGTKTLAGLLQLANSAVTGDRELMAEIQVDDGREGGRTSSYGWGVATKGEQVTAHGSAAPSRGEGGSTRRIRERIRADLGGDAMLLDLGAITAMSVPDRRRYLYGICTTLPDAGTEWTAGEVRKELTHEVRRACPTPEQEAMLAPVLNEILGQDPAGVGDLLRWVDEALVRTTEQLALWRETGIRAEAALRELPEAAHGAAGVSQAQQEQWRGELAASVTEVHRLTREVAAAEQRSISQAVRQRMLADRQGEIGGLLREREGQSVEEGRCKTEMPTEKLSALVAETAELKSRINDLNTRALTLNGSVIDARKATRELIEVEGGLNQLFVVSGMQYLEACEAGSCPLDRQPCPRSAEVRRFLLIKDEVTNATEEIKRLRARQGDLQAASAVGESAEAKRDEILLEIGRLRTELSSLEDCRREHEAKSAQAEAARLRAEENAKRLLRVQAEVDGLQAELAEASKGQRIDLIRAQLVAQQANQDRVQQQLALAVAAVDLGRERDRLGLKAVEARGRLEVLRAVRQGLGPSGIQGQILAALVAPITGIAGPMVSEVLGDDFALRLLTPEGRETCDFGVVRGGGFVGLGGLSGGESVVVSVAVVAALVALSGSPLKLLLLDNIEAVDDLEMPMTGSRRATLCESIADLVEAGTLDQVIMAGLDAPRDLDGRIHRIGMEEVA